MKKPTTNKTNTDISKQVLTEAQIIDIKSLLEYGVPNSEIAVACKTNTHMVSRVKTKMKKTEMLKDCCRHLEQELKRIDDFNINVRIPNELVPIKTGIKRCSGPGCGRLFFATDRSNEIYCARCKGVMANKYVNTYRVIE